MRKRLLAVATTALLIFGAVGMAGAISYDAVSEFSIDNGNPNGVWSYGWMPNDFSTFNLYTASKIVTIDIWSGVDVVFPHWYRLGSYDNSPCIARNDGTNTLYTTIAPGQLYLHPSSSFEPSVLRWTAPSDGLYSVDGQFLPGDYGIMQVGVRLGSNWLWQGVDSGAFSFDISFVAGQTIDFLVYGGYGSGSTPIELTITSTSVPEPSLMVLLGISVMGLAGLRRWWKD